MFNAAIQKYKKLNEIADQNGIVVFGGGDDMNAPLGELKQAFEIDTKLYNRSIPGLSIKDAVAAYDACVAPLTPETVLIHIGSDDLDFFQEDPAGFDQQYRNLISYIRGMDRHCRIALVSLRNDENNAGVSALNTHLKYIAESEHCEYENINGKQVWNPRNTQEAVSFVHSMSFIRPLKTRRPIYDLVRMIFCYGA